MAATRAAREVRADMGRIANLLDGWQVDFVPGATNVKSFPIKPRAENRQKMPTVHAR
jgi:hypothetical protein